MANSPWTLFWDMHSGGGTKEPPYEHIYIEAPVEEAKIVFYNRFGHNPERMSCTCCGDDYSIREWPTLGEAADYHARQARVPVEEYVKRDYVLVVRADEIGDEERSGEVPYQGYVWVGG